ncbi:hypothetical protein U5801_27300 [Lamprobacter modestohalophilus]|jgi:hypothetical protein|uniref:hypothetical protein n=1 Tax=Lamprobacter modestohalophilus TaxID=1064514 RepID=UPI002ADECD4F|nr:hypothetical protein [Lamprobacter modestohalophilus]MEA1052203.1 hypothetical protein [Lamprobacter modestohalophilus]MEA1053482.1 hypothetical protein [Lamprobacter modestohalophilus]
MKRPQRPLSVRIAFEPNRFSAERLSEVYAQLKPTESRLIESAPAAAKTALPPRQQRRGAR